MRARHVVGVIERRNPIPPGVYWLDVHGLVTDTSRGSARLHWRLWLAEHESTVDVLRKEDHFDRLWVLFRVKKPTPRWPASARLGLPTVANKGAKTTEPDTIQRPPPEKQPSPFEAIEQVMKGAGLLLVLYLLSRR